MIYIGCDTFSNHPIFTKHPHNYKSKSTLVDYAKHLNCVEIDYPFYYVPTKKAIHNWIKQVPSNFKFILKANRRMTKQDYNQHTTPQQWKDTVIAYHQDVQEMMQTHQLLGVLLQFPRSFMCTQANFGYLKKIRYYMHGIPLILEFRSPTWYQSSIQEKHDALSLGMMGYAIATVDEPHSNYDGVPFVPIINNSQLIMIRLHGENTYGWSHRFNNPNWRTSRTLYNYSKPQLQSLAKLIKSFPTNVKNICVIFNNNSGRDAAPNALLLKKILKL